MLCLQYRLPGHSSSLSETHHSKITKKKFHSFVIYDMSEQLLKGLFEDPTWLGSVGTSTVSLAESILKFGNKWYLRWHFRSVGSSHLSPHKLSGMISVPGLPQVPGLFSGWDQWTIRKIEVLLFLLSFENVEQWAIFQPQSQHSSLSTFLRFLHREKFSI